MKVNELIESMVKTASIQEKSNCWLSQKQVKFLSDIGNAKQEFIPNRRWSKRIYIHTNKYDIEILQSPQNGAGFTTIINKEIANKRINAEFEQKEQENKEKIENLVNELNNLKLAMENTNKAILPEETIKLMYKIIEDKENELKQLRG